MNEEIPKYRKKAKKKRVEKANHKHIYEKIAINKEGHIPMQAKVCRICGKLVGGMFFTYKSPDFNGGILCGTIDEVMIHYPEIKVVQYCDLTESQIADNPLLRY